MMDATPVLDVRDLKKSFQLPLGLVQGLMRHKAEVVTAVDGVSLSVARGEILGIVGESGCGKTTLLRCIARLYPVNAGQILFEGRDILGMQGDELRAERRKIQVVFQDPYSSLNPRMTVGQMLSEILAVHRIGPPAERHQRAVHL